MNEGPTWKHVNCKILDISIPSSSIWSLTVVTYIDMISWMISASLVVVRKIGRSPCLVLSHHHLVNTIHEPDSASKGAAGICNVLYLVSINICTRSVSRWKREATSCLSSWMQMWTAYAIFDRGSLVFVANRFQDVVSCLYRRCWVSLRVLRILWMRNDVLAVIVIDFLSLASLRGVSRFSKSPVCWPFISTFLKGVRVQLVHTAGSMIVVQQW